MGPVVSCLQPQPRYPVLAAPPVKRRQVKKSEIMRPQTKRLETIQERLKELDTVAPPEVVALPSLLTPTESTVAWVQLEGAFSMDAPAKPLSQKLVAKFKIQDEEIKTLEKQLVQSEEMEKSMAKSVREKLAAEAIGVWDESDDKDPELDQTIYKNERLNDMSNNPTGETVTLQEAEGTLFEETLTMKEDEGPIRKVDETGTSLREAIAKFDRLGRKANTFEKQVAKKVKNESASENSWIPETRSVTFELPKPPSRERTDKHPHDSAVSDVMHEENSGKKHRSSEEEPGKASPRAVSGIVSN